LHHVLARDRKIDITISDESRYICGWQKDQRYGKIRHEGDIQAVSTLELNICAA